MEGPLFTEVKASLYGQEEAPLVRNFIAGLGGRDVTYLDIEKMARRSLKSLEAGRVDDEVEWFGLRK
jgi:pyruvate/2-oxoacid:ferredoxin oxidoreductase alpha subunit